MQLADDTSVGGAPELPPQAQTGLPGMAADLGDIAPAPPPEQPLLQAAFGDRGAQQYQALRSASQAANTPALPAASITAGEATPGGQVASALGAGLVGAATGDPLAGVKMYRQRQQQQLQLSEEFRRNASEFYTALMPAAFKQFTGRPDLAAAFLMSQARTRGLNVDPAVLMKLNQDITDGKMNETELDALIANPQTPISTIERIGSHAKFADDLAKGRAESQKAIAESQAATAPPGSTPATTAGAEAQAKLRGSQLENDKKQMDVDTFYDTLERRVTKEATDRGMRPGTAEFTNYTENRKVQLDTWAKRQAFLNTPLMGRNSEDFNQADRAGKFATEALKLLNDPSIAQNRGVLEGRLRNAAWRFGFAQSSNEDLYQSLSNLSGLMASKVYSGGIRNMKWIDRVMEHTLKPGDETPLLKDKVNVLLRAAREQQQGIINTASTPIGRLQPTVPQGTEVLPGEAPMSAHGGGGGLSPAAQGYLSSLGSAATPPAP